MLIPKIMNFTKLFGVYFIIRLSMLFLRLIIQLNHEYDHKTGLKILGFPLAVKRVVSGIIPILD